MHLEEMVVEIINLIVLGIEICGAAVIVIGVVRAVGQFVKKGLVIDLGCAPTMRIGLAEYLILALEFQVAADVLKTAVSPSWSKLGMLAAVVVLRTVLTLLLDREVKQLCEEGHLV